MKHKQLECKSLVDTFIQNEVDHFSGVPDSLLSSFSFYLEDKFKNKHTITANEGNAVGLAIGYYMASGRLPLVYMQNSGLGNAIDPLVSLADPSVFSVPMLLLISWRGQPGLQDEPQHSKQGAITVDLLDDLGIPYTVLARRKSVVNEQISQAAADARKNNRPVALIVEKGLFAEYKVAKKSKNGASLTREQAVAIISDSLESDDAIVAGIGKVSRELFEHRKNNSANHSKDLLIVGGMGHASSIALGVALQKPDKKIYCLDGDGATLMHLGALTCIGKESPENFYHIVINNGSHDSVGGQPTASFLVSIPDIAQACRYRSIFSVGDAEELTAVLKQTRSIVGPVLIEVLVKSGARVNLVRPDVHPRQNKELFRAHLET